MKSTRPYPFVMITKKGEASLTAGHPWVYDAEIVSCHNNDGESIKESDLENGCLVDILSSKGRYLGTGLLSLQSKIRVRLLSRNANDRFDTAFWKRRLQYAIDYRKTVMGDDFDACRLVFGEADMLPGLTVDLFHDLLVVQTLSYGMEQRKDILFSSLLEIMKTMNHPIRGIYERNDVALRDREGLEQGKGWYLPSLTAPDGLPDPTTTIWENGICYHVDVENGQKTGFFLDQKYNRLAVQKLAKDKTVLDCFTHTGSFALNAAKGGARKVTAVDVSETAIQMTRENASLNQQDNMEFLVADVFDLLPRLEETGGRPYDFIILDPPAFTKSRRTLDSALRGYKEINLRAMKLLPRGGYLATCSCSHFADEWHFRKMLESAAKDASVQLRQIEARQQSPDHPILWGVPETDYLKFFLFQVV